MLNGLQPPPEHPLRPRLPPALLVLTGLALLADEPPTITTGFSGAADLAGPAFLLDGEHPTQAFLLDVDAMLPAEPSYTQDTLSFAFRIDVGDTGQAVELTLSDCETGERLLPPFAPTSFELQGFFADCQEGEVCGTTLCLDATLTGDTPTPISWEVHAAVAGTSPDTANQARVLPITLGATPDLEE